MIPIRIPRVNSCSISILLPVFSTPQSIGVKEEGLSFLLSSHLSLSLSLLLPPLLQMLWGEKTIMKRLVSTLLSFLTFFSMIHEFRLFLIFLIPISFLHNGSFLVYFNEIYILFYVLFWFLGKDRFFMIFVWSYDVFVV